MQSPYWKNLAYHKDRENRELTDYINEVINFRWKITFENIQAAELTFKSLLSTRQSEEMNLSRSHLNEVALLLYYMHAFLLNFIYR